MCPCGCSPGSGPGSGSSASREKECGEDYDSERDASSILEDCSSPLSISSRLNWVGLGGGVGVVASGPETLTRAASNAVARVGLTRGVELGGVGLHTESFSL